MNTDLAKQKEMLLEISIKITQHIKLLMDSFPATNKAHLDAVPASLDDLLE
jgi:hypothetical protein